MHLGVLHIKKTGQSDLCSILFLSIVLFIRQFYIFEIFFILL